MTVAWNHVEKTVCRLLGFIHISLAIATIVGGARRFPAPNYTQILDLTNGQVWPYGFMWLVGGLMMMVHSTGWRLAGTAFVVAVSSLWATLFAIAAYEVPNAAYTPVAAYGGYGLLNAVMFWVMFERWWRRRNYEAP